MRNVLRKWTPKCEKYFKYQNSLTHFCSSLSLECFGEVSRKSVKSTLSYKFAQSGCIPLKIKCEILTPKHCKQLAPHQEIISPPKTPNQWEDGTSNDNGSRFSREKYRIAVRFFLLNFK